MKKSRKILLVAVDMGYGHQRTAYPLKYFAYQQKVINANNYEDMPIKDKNFWSSTRAFYEFISNFKRIPLVGEAAFNLFDKLQKIPAFYPRRDLSKPNLSLKVIYNLFKRGWGYDLIEKLKSICKESGENMPLVSSFFIPAFMAEFFGYPGEIYCVICDADVARTWIPLNPKKSRIKYFAPNLWVKDRLKLYGVKDKNIFLTGYPLPLENIGEESQKIVKEDLKKRIINLDPDKEYRNLYAPIIRKNLGIIPKKSNRMLTIMFSIGGAGAQKEMVFDFVESISEKIKRKEVKIIFSCGIKESVKLYFENSIKKFGFLENVGQNIEIIFERDIGSYFSKFNQKLRETDILWTKPSELSFYSGLGIPIVMSPPVGSQEDFNRRWILKVGSGILEENPIYAKEWLFDYIKSGRLAEAAMEGFVEIQKMGALKMKEICFK